MSVEAKTIQLFLPNGEPRGIRIADITTRIVQVIQVPRPKLAQFFERNESEQIGVYFLFGDSEASSSQAAYIGQTEDLKSRLKKHHNDKEFWQTAVIVVSRTQSFTQAHIRYLEWLSISEACKASRFTLENGNQGSKPYVPEPMEADVLDAFETASTLLATLGFPIFDYISQTQVTKQNVFFCKGPSSDAKGIATDDGFRVFKGSKTRRTVVKSAKRFESRIAQLENDGILRAINEEQFEFTRDYDISSPSYAAAIVLARSANGWHEWKRSDGASLHDVYRAE